MHASARQLLTLSSTLLSLAALPAAAHAQGTLKPVRVTAEGISRADRLRVEAEALPTRLDTFKKAAKLYEQSAAARAPGDTATATCLRTAAFLRYYTGDTHSSTDLMEKAAQRSAEHGDIVGAATSYIDAAILAVEIQQGGRALDLGRRAEQLAASPLLNDAQRDALRTRMTGWHEVAVALKQ